MKKRQKINITLEISVVCAMLESARASFRAKDVAGRIRVSVSRASLILRRLSLRGVVDRHLVTYASRSRSKNDVYEYSIRRKSARLRSLFLACLGLETLPFPRKRRLVKGRCRV
jgi:DNA-binding MarR family transcriptional regulator